MQDFFKNLNSLYWWISIVVVGIVLNILSAYFRDAIDTSFSKMSNWWANRSQKIKDKREEQISKLVGNKEAQNRLTINEFRNRIRAIYFLIFGMSIVTISQVVVTSSIEQPFVGISFKLTTLICGSFIIYISMSYFFKALNQMDLVSAALKKEKEPNS